MWKNPELSSPVYLPNDVNVCQWKSDPIVNDVYRNSNTKRLKLIFKI